MKLRFLFAIFFLCTVLNFGQGLMNSGNFNPDSLKSITLSGKITADSSMMNGMYYLDINSDNQPDYILSFGPYWYKPDSSSAVRPKVGDTITITGGLHNGMLNFLPVVVVYSINGNFWRSPFDSFWNNMGRQSMMGGMNHGGMDYAFGFKHDSLQSINLSGTLLVDSTFMYNHYYLDTNNDGTPDYLLNFGPPWYVSSSGAKLPVSGDKISISGWKLGNDYMNMIVVYKINGQVWMDSAQINNNMGGGWIHKNMGHGQRFFNPFDTTDWMEINPGWNQGGMMGGGNAVPDSLYCQILEDFPENIPNTAGQNAFAAFEIGIFNPDGSNGMMQSGRMGGQMNFNSKTNFQLHFTNMQTAGFNVKANNLKAEFWNSQLNTWNTISNAVINLSNNSVTFSQSQVSNFIILTADKITGIAAAGDYIPDNFSLKQNYPNPFNPGTTIEFSIKENSFVNLSVFNILGQKVATLINNTVTAGSYKINFNAAGLSSGIYFYRLSSGNNVKVMKMELLK